MESKADKMRDDIGKMAARMTDKELAMLYSLARAIDTRKKDAPEK